jgi:hypothetical protein
MLECQNIIQLTKSSSLFFSAAFYAESFEKITGTYLVSLKQEIINQVLREPRAFCDIVTLIR